MSDLGHLSSLVAELRAARDFDDAAAAVLGRLADMLRPIVATEQGTLGRGLVHLRSARMGYRALAVRDLDAGAGVEAAVAPSATAFGWVERRAHAIGIDLGLGRGTDLETGETFDAPSSWSSADASGSRQSMLAREVTHLVALPLVTGAGAVAGMVSLELSWSMRTALPWDAAPWVSPLRLVADVAAPFLLARPTERPDAEEPSDPLLPVLGERTRPLVRVLRVFVDQDETLLITGPTGAGKTRLAEWCHQRSRRRHRPFRTANLLAVPETMQLGELFGWRKGAFTGAAADHVGLVESAEGGTLFLDEIDKLSLAAQAALLRLLESRRAAPLGGGRERALDVRFIVGTNADLRAKVDAGELREDLYYRINVLPVHLEPLRKRLDEVPGWARVMLSRRHAESGNEGIVTLTPEAIEALQGFDWPGNLRQLDNVVRRAYALFLAETAADDGDSLAASGVVSATLVRRALSLEGRAALAASAGGAARVLADAGRSLVEEALARRSRGEPPITLAQLDALRGVALRAAGEKLGSVKDADDLFGAEALVASRNHTKDYRRELAAAVLLDELLSE